MSHSGSSKACGYVLDRLPEVARKLSLEANLWMFVGESEALGLHKMRLIVPQGVALYHVRRTGKQEEYFFACLATDPTSQAYLSEVSLGAEGHLNYMHNVGTLCNYPWFDAPSSNLVLSRLVERHAYQGTSTERFHLFSNCVQGQGTHPLQR